MRARGILASPANEILVSSASAWEVATKHRLGKLPSIGPFVTDMRGWILKAGFRELPVGIAHAQRAGAWPLPHKDPFDRMLAAQAEIEGVPLITRDPALSAFGVPLIW
ncbi:MAG: PIN domain nuclease [Gemmatimonadetes bacterium]|nr:PIN domain nuclease [Gemmatimonadota bacterium]